MAFATRYHQSRRQYHEVPTSEPEIFHVFDVTQAVWHELTGWSDENRYYACTVSLLHDIQEDTPCTEAELHEAEFSQEVVAAVSVLTHFAGTNYNDYVLAAADHSWVTHLVKRLDAERNLRRLKRFFGYVEEKKILALKHKWQGALSILYANPNHGDKKEL